MQVYMLYNIHNIWMRSWWCIYSLCRFYFFWSLQRSKVCQYLCRIYMTMEMTTLFIKLFDTHQNNTTYMFGYIDLTRLETTTVFGGTC